MRITDTDLDGCGVDRSSWDSATTLTCCLVLCVMLCIAAAIWGTTR